MVFIKGILWESWSPISQHFNGDRPMCELDCFRLLTSEVNSTEAATHSGVTGSNSLVNALSVSNLAQASMLHRKTVKTLRYRQKPLVEKVTCIGAVANSIQYLYSQTLLLYSVADWAIATHDKNPRPFQNLWLRRNHSLRSP
ncbi:hypothetical protein [[Limnothrix rosea] IAM M-220]|uniref:hypothetical protein n=1 Tax=[Limnothrix rosea] IAM M-220 TaxID=454133 RepID=UPI0011157703|nr:hypothetical protein [[Limnothrix rosea] IAM M-220]